MTRPARVVIDLAALQHNFSKVREFAPDSKVMAIIKADGYGHGITRVAKSLTTADAFGVACQEEAEQLRVAGIQQSIILLEGVYSAEELTRAHALRLDLVVHHHYQVEMLEHDPLPTPLTIWLKIDSGMHRLGFAPEEVTLVRQRLKDYASVGEIRLMTHFASASDPEDPLTQLQIQIFNDSCAGKEGQRTLASSSAIMAFPDSHADWVRPGLMLYGVSPMVNSIGTDYGLRPVMSLESELISIKSLQKGDSVGYGGIWQCPEAMPVGIVAAGYGDGFPRQAKSGTPIMVNGLETSIIGNTSMDMLAVDLRSMPNAKVGDPVELWGSQLPIERIAQHADTIPYELLCGVHKRLHFVVKNG